MHNEELHNLYSSNIIRVIKSRRMRWAGKMVDIRNAYRILVENLGKNHLVHPGIDSRIILKWMIK
jgi:hypothetical protein